MMVKTRSSGAEAAEMPAAMAGVHSIPVAREPAENQQKDVLANHNRRIRRKRDCNDEMKRILVMMLSGSKTV